MSLSTHTLGNFDPTTYFTFPFDYADGTQTVGPAGPLPDSHESDVFPLNPETSASFTYDGYDPFGQDGVSHDDQPTAGPSNYAERDCSFQRRTPPSILSPMIGSTANITEHFSIPSAGYEHQWENYHQQTTNQMSSVPYPHDVLARFAQTPAPTYDHDYYRYGTIASGSHLDAGTIPIPAQFNPQPYPPTTKPDHLQPDGSVHSSHFQEQPQTGYIIPLQPERGMAPVHPSQFQTVPNIISGLPSRPSAASNSAPHAAAGPVRRSQAPRTRHDGAAGTYTTRRQKTRVADVNLNVVVARATRSRTAARRQNQVGSAAQVSATVVHQAGHPGAASTARPVVCGFNGCEATFVDPTTFVNHLKASPNAAVSGHGLANHNGSEKLTCSWPNCAQVVSRSSMCRHYSRHLVIRNCPEPNCTYYAHGERSDFMRTHCEAKHSYPRESREAGQLDWKRSP